MRLLYGFMYGHPGKKLLFMGAELAPWDEWSHERALDWGLLQHESHRGVQSWLRDLNALYRDSGALYQGDVDPEGFAWIDCQDMENSVISFMRQSGGQSLIFICNFTPNNAFSNINVFERKK